LTVYSTPTPLPDHGPYHDFYLFGIKGFLFSLVGEIRS
jgi:hypothetical protein